MTDFTLNLVDAIISGRATDIETAFQEAITDKISIAMDTRRTEIAQSMFTKESVEEEELTLEDYSVEELEDFMMSEDFEQLDELSRKTLSSYIGKARSSRNNAVKDLYKSPEGSAAERDKNRKTANNRTDGKERAIDTLRGKTNKDRAKKGLPTRYYTEELTLEDYSVEELEDFMMSEDFEQLDELSKATLGSYVKKASGKLASHGINMVGSLEKSDIANAAYHGRKIDKRQKGISKATDKLTKEEFELEEAVTASQLIANHNSSDHGGAQHFSNVDGKHHSWNYVKKNKEGTKYEVTPDKGEAEGIAHKGKFLKMPK